MASWLRPRNRSPSVHSPSGPSKIIGLLDLDPGQLPALGAERVEFVGHGALLSEKRLAGTKPLLARNDRVVHGRSPSVAGQLRARRRPEASSSQGARWKRPISRYIAVMPSIGRRPDPEEQSAIGGASFAAIHAMSAEVGEAAKASQPAAPLACHAPALPVFAA